MGVYHLTTRLEMLQCSLSSTLLLLYTGRVPIDHRDISLDAVDVEPYDTQTQEAILDALSPRISVCYPSARRFRSEFVLYSFIHDHPNQTISTGDDVTLLCPVVP